MGICGCLPLQEACEVGRGLMREAQCVQALIWHPAFVLYPDGFREVVWRTYHEAVEAYLRHCGYVSGTVVDAG